MFRKEVIMPWRSGKTTNDDEPLECFLGPTRMNSPSARNFSRLAVAIIVAGVVIGAGIFASSYLGTSRTVTETTTVTSTFATTSGTPQLYQLEFSQESNCPYGSWLIPWAVVLNGQTVVQPSNATLPLSSNGAHLTGDSNYSTILFSLPNGTYNYTILPDNPLGSAQSGNVTIDGSGVVVQVYAFITAMGCSSTSSSG